MIDPKELRIRSLIYELTDTPKDPEAKVLFEVAAINSLTNTVIEMDDHLTQLDYCKPIPLTEEWLLKFGFKKTEYGLFKNYIALKNEIKGYWLVYQYSPTVSKGHLLYNLNPQFVHQFQNIYYSLTVEELAITSGLETSAFLI